MIRSLVILFKKDLLLELRGRESITLLFGLSVLLSLIAMFGVASAFLSANVVLRIFPGLSWMIFLFAATLCLGRGFEQEVQARALDALLVGGISPALQYLSKVIVFFALLFIAQALSMLLLAGLLEISIWPVLGNLLVVSALVVFAYTAISVLLAAIATNSRIRGMLLPLLVLPLTFPLLASGIELFHFILEFSYLPWESVWLTLLVVADVLYLVLGLNLFSYAIRE